MLFVDICMSEFDVALCEKGIPINLPQEPA